MASLSGWDGNGPAPQMKVNFQKEISNMMHGFGDNPNPNAATVLLVENIVLQQLCSILQEAYDYAKLRGSKIINNVDIIFLMRKNKLKLKRLHGYQMKLDTSDTIINTIEDDKAQVIKNKRTHIDVIKELDESDEVDSIDFDPVEYRRKVRAAQLSESLPMDKYLVYHKARCASFKSGFMPGWARNFSKLEMWINPNKEFRITQQAMEVLSFIACETIGELIDCVFLIRQDAKRKPGDPMSKFDGGYFGNPSSASNAVYIKSGYEGVPAITVAEIREVLRRQFPPRVGMNGIFSRNIHTDLPSKYIAF